MSARDANARLSRRIREAQPAHDRLAPFKPGEHSELPRWPADAFDPRPIPNRERITIPPDGKTQVVCDNWPECDCDTDCNDAAGGLTDAHYVLLVVLFALAVVGTGLIYLAVRP